MHVGIVSPCSSGPLSDLLPGSGGLNLGWGAYFIATLVRALIGLGHRVSVVTLSPDLSTPRLLVGPQLTYYVYPTRTRRRMRDLYRFERQGLKEGISQAKPDLLHAHWSYEFALACLESRLPTVVTNHDNAFQILRYAKDLYRLGRLGIQLHVLRKARFLTGVSPYIANSLRRFASNEIEVIPNPVQLPHEANQTCDRESGPLKVATVLNGWQRRKNPKAAIKAFNILLHDLPDAEMHMYGYGFETAGPASQWAKSRRLDRNIHFCGFLPYERLEPKLRNMSILLHPAFEESFGMCVGEAMASALPVIAGVNSGAISWLLDEGRAGYLTDVTVPARIAQTILTCVQDRAERYRKQKHAYDRVLNQFSPLAVGKQYQCLYDRVLHEYS